jgi:hypothetical protein
VDKNVIHVDGDIAFVNEFAEKVIHHGLKGGWGIGESKEHHHWFEQTAICLECGLPLVTIADPNIVITPADIQLRKERRPAAMHSRELIHELPDEQKQGSISDGECVQPVVVLDGSKVTILLLHKKEREHVRGLGLTNISFP